MYSANLYRISRIPRSLRPGGRRHRIRSSEGPVAVAAEQAVPKLGRCAGGPPLPPLCVSCSSRGADRALPVRVRARRAISGPSHNCLSPKSQGSAPRRFVFESRDCNFGFTYQNGIARIFGGGTMGFPLKESYPGRVQIIEGGSGTFSMQASHA
ncbi:hypothetical protein SKAU_G00025010 [Synaphobranchus kaupii]|uniref:Uncharacterized protein n=1 Tax=Synaphobranchus kaupii TaxID=118154 RepID=A0A9Q1GDS2_SYNKA|nr:hypothetical protein SKAU_G00025010 [Synaphobranchus kaupii]